jgi:hypothetical protein
MASSIQLLRSNTAKERPFPGNLLDGQPALNTNSEEPGLFFKTTDGSIVKIGPAAITSDGSPPNTGGAGQPGNATGELWLDKSVNPPILKVYDGAQWVDAGSGSGGGSGQVTLLRWSTLATAGQTVLSGADSSSQQLAYTAGLEEVYVNGAFLRRGVDYTATNGLTITISAPLALNDEITVLAWTPFVVGSQIVNADVDPNAGITYEKLNLNNGIVNSDVNANAGIQSSKLSFTQSGAGAVQRAVEAKLKDTVSVKDFGAVGNGATDDTAAIQAAIDTTSAAGGGVVLIPAGTYNINGATGPFTNLNPSHGGGLWLKTGVKLIGAGIDLSILKNTSQNWRMVVGIRGGNSMGLSDLTIDGDWPNKTPVPLSTDPKRGEGIIVWNKISDLNDFTIQNIKVKNTGHYAIGLQNVLVNGCSIENVYFENIGGDCIDIKDTLTNGKSLLINGVYVNDGCGHNDANHNNQAVLDIGGQVVASNIFISGLDSYGSQIGNAGVRFRAPLIAEPRFGSRGSSVSNVYVKSSKLPSEGSGSSKRIIGVAVNDEDISINNVYVENCFYGVRIFDSGDGVPRRVSATNLIAVSCQGAASDAVGIDLTNASSDCIVSGSATDCEIGCRIGGAGHDLTLNLIANEVGLSATSAVLTRCRTSLNISGSSVAASTNNFVDDNTASTLKESLKVLANRKASLDLISTANDNSWTGDRAHGTIRFFSEDQSGVGAGLRAEMLARMTGAAGSSTVLEFNVHNSPKLTIAENSINTGVPFLLATYTATTLPSASGNEGAIIYVSNEAGGKTLAFSDGADWRRVQDRQIIS